MSIEAQLWVSQLPLDICSLAEFRVLDKLADHAHRDGRNAFRGVQEMASELECSGRTVQRALRALEVRGLIERGDQRLVGHLRADRRPTVWELPLTRWRRPAQHPELDGVTPDVTPPGPVDKSSRGDRSGRHGVTAAVALGTGNEPSISGTSPATDRASDAWRLCSDGTSRHEYSRKAGVCVYCGLRRPA